MFVFAFFFYFPLGHMQIIWIYPSPHSINFVVNQMQILRFLCLSPTAICSCCCCPIRSCCCFCCCCCVLWLIRIDQLFHQCHQYALLLIEFAACKNSWIFKWPTWGNSSLSLPPSLSHSACFLDRVAWENSASVTPERDLPGISISPGYMYCVRDARSQKICKTFV